MFSVDFKKVRRAYKHPENRPVRMRVRELKLRNGQLQEKVIYNGLPLGESGKHSELEKDKTCNVFADQAAKDASAAWADLRASANMRFADYDNAESTRENAIRIGILSSEDACLASNYEQCQGANKVLKLAACLILMCVFLFAICVVNQAGGKWSSTDAPLPALSMAERTAFANYEFVALLDCSGSMNNTFDCPLVQDSLKKGIVTSRFDFAARQLERFARQLPSRQAGGLSIIGFGKKVKRFDRSVQSQTYESQRLKNGADFAAALKAALNNLNTDSDRAQQKPLALLVFTDGDFGLTNQNPPELKKSKDEIMSLLDSSKRPDSAVQKLKIVFIAVGKSWGNSEFFSELQRERSVSGSREGAIEILPFEEIKNSSVSKALLEVIE